MLKVHLGSLMFALIFGLTFMFSKVVLDAITPMALIAYRFLWAIIGMETLRRLKIIRIRFDRRFIKPVVTVILFQPILYFLFEIYGLNLIASAEAGMMIALIPVFVAIFSALILNESPSLAQVGFILLSVAGILLIQLADLRGGNLLGFGLMLLAVMSASAFNIASRSASKVLNPAEITYFMMLTGALTFNSFYLIQLVLENRLADYFLNLTLSTVLWPLLYLGFVASIGGFFLVNYALKHLPAHVSSIYANLATVVSLIAGAIVLDEVLVLNQYIGSIMILIGVYGTVLYGRRPKRAVINGRL